MLASLKGFRRPCPQGVRPRHSSLTAKLSSRGS
jgi:hypothetical protein